MAYVLGGLLLLAIVVSALIYLRVLRKRTRDFFIALADEFGWRYLGNEAGSFRDFEFVVLRIAEAYHGTPTGWVENHISGRWNGIDVDVAQCGSQIDRETTAAFIIAMARNRSSRSHVLVSADPLVEEVGHRLHLVDTGLGSQMLGRGIEVLAKKKEFAANLLDEGLAAWMRGHVRKFSFELDNGAAATYTRAAQPEDVRATIDILSDFCARLRERDASN